MHLKPSKCIIVSCLQLTEALETLIRMWLCQHVPAFAEFKIQSSGKYLGWILGVNSVQLSYQAPLSKFVNRVSEVCHGQDPAAVAICTYNQRAVTVLSYVAQFAPPPEDSKLECLSHWAVHRILRMPPNCMARELTYAISFCSAVNPLPLKSYCLASLFRFAASEREYLVQLRIQVLDLIGLDAPIALTNSLHIPEGGLLCTPLLSSLLEALSLEGPLGAANEMVANNPDHQWLLDFPTSDLPSKYKGIQTALCSILSEGERTRDLAASVASKLLITFRPIEFPQNWFTNFNAVLQNVSLYIRMCWLKSVCGGWCTSVRTQAVSRWDCVFGCPDATDSIGHYLECPILWLYARETLDLHEESIYLESRLCILNPTIDKLRLLAFSFALYHSIRNDPGCKRENGQLQPGHIVQNRAIGLARASKHLVHVGN